MTAKPLITRLRYGCETALVYAVYYFFKALPLPLASNAGGALMRHLGPYLPPSRTARRNLQLAFPEKTEKEQEDILQGMWENLGRVAAEYPHLEEMWNTAEMVGAEHFQEAHTAGQPVIFYSAHLANWEAAPLSAQKHGIDVHSVYRRPNNQGVESLLRKARGAVSGGVIPKGKEGARQMLALLRAGKAVGILMDQKLNEGLPIPFFGHDAMTAPAIASFALKLSCRVYPTRVERLEGAKLRITVYPAMEVRSSGNPDQDTKEMLRQINATIESWVRARPEQWLWIHRRWPERAA